MSSIRNAIRITIITSSIMLLSACAPEPAFKKLSQIEDSGEMSEASRHCKQKFAEQKNALSYQRCRLDSLESLLTGASFPYMDAFRLFRLKIEDVASDLQSNKLSKEKAKLLSNLAYREFQDTIHGYDDIDRQAYREAMQSLSDSMETMSKPSMMPAPRQPIKCYTTHRAMSSSTSCF